MQVADDIVLAQDHFTESGQERPEIPTAIFEDPDVDHASRPARKDARDSLGRWLVGHADQQIDPALCSPKTFEDLIAHLMVIEMQMQRDPEGLVGAAGFRRRPNDVKLPWSRRLPIGQVMRQRVTSLERVALSVDSGMKAGHTPSEAGCRWNRRVR